jgi:hypothetical protein
MENRNVRCENRKSVVHQRASEVAVRETSLSEEELHLLIQFFQLLDHWDRELVQNGEHESEVSLCQTL